MSGKGGGLQGFIDEGRARLGGGKPLSEILSQVRDNPAGFLPPPTQDAARAVGSLFGRPYEETPIGMFSSMRGKPIEEQLKVSESDPAWGFAGTTIGKGIRAFHGSPHSFDKFDLSKIGTGEGAQAYGHGLYFAENEGVARSYRDGLSGKTANPLDARGLDPAWVSAAKMMRESGMADDVVRKSLASAYRKATPDQIEAAFQAGNPGHMYEVNINASPDEFLDWDKPLGQQSDFVRSALPKPPLKTRNIGFNENLGENLIDVMANGGSMGVFPESKIKDVLADPLKFDPRSGALMYESAQIVPGEYRNSPMASKVLRERGIPGIKYLDQGSRAAGDGSRNYVVFNPSIIEIMRKYGILAPVATFGAMAYGDNESANNGNR